MLLGRVRREDFGALEVLGQGSAQVSIFKGAQVLGLRRVRRANLGRLDGKVCFAQAAADQKLLVCDRSRGNALA